MKQYYPRSHTDLLVQVHGAGKTLQFVKQAFIKICSAWERVLGQLTWKHWGLPVFVFQRCRSWSKLLCFLGRTKARPWGNRGCLKDFLSPVCVKHLRQMTHHLWQHCGGTCLFSLNRTQHTEINTINLSLPIILLLARLETLFPALVWFANHNIHQTLHNQGFI